MRNCLIEAIDKRTDSVPHKRPIHELGKFGYYQQLVTID